MILTWEGKYGTHQYLPARWWGMSAAFEPEAGIRQPLYFVGTGVMKFNVGTGLQKFDVGTRNEEENVP